MILALVRVVMRVYAMRVITMHDASRWTAFGIEVHCAKILLVKPPPRLSSVAIKVSSALIWAPRRTVQVGAKISVVMVPTASHLVMIVTPARCLYREIKDVIVVMNGKECQ